MKDIQLRAPQIPLWSDHEWCCYLNLWPATQLKTLSSFSQRRAETALLKLHILSLSACDSLFAFELCLSYTQLKCIKMPLMECVVSKPPQCVRCCCIHSRLFRRYHPLHSGIPPTIDPRLCFYLHKNNSTAALDVHIASLYTEPPDIRFLIINREN